MLEIILLWVLGKKIGEMAYQKGYSRTAFIVLFVGLWFTCEIAGAVLGVVLARGRDEDMLKIWLLGFVAAMVGGAIAFLIVRLLPEQELRDRRRRHDDDSDYGEDDFDDDYDSRRRHPRQLDDYGDDKGRSPSRSRQDDDENRQRIRER